MVLLIVKVGMPVLDTLLTLPHGDGKGLTAWVILDTVMLTIVTMTNSHSGKSRPGIKEYLLLQELPFILEITMCRRLSSSRIKHSSLWGQWQGKKSMQTHKWTQAAGGDGIGGDFQGWQVSADELKMQNRPEEWTECWYLELLLVFSRQGCGQRNSGISPSQPLCRCSWPFDYAHYYGFRLCCTFFSHLLVGYFFGYFSLIIFLLVLRFCPMQLIHVALFLGLSFIFRYLVEPRSILYSCSCSQRSQEILLCFPVLVQSMRLF